MSQSFQEIEQIEKAAKIIKSPELSRDTPKEQLLNIPSAYWLYLKSYDVLTTARSISLPVLVLQGEKDYQVLP
jgi:fermentation-respiration switch protein FrsA (DUF1100 family)